MTIQTKESNPTISLSELDLPFAASSIMDYEDAIINVVGNQLFVGYLADDNDCTNPLEDMDGSGRIHTSHRHSDSHQEMQEALGLDRDWEPDLDLVELHDLRSAWIVAATQASEFREWATVTAGANAGLNEAYFKRRAQKLWRETNGEYIYNQDCIGNFEFTDDVRLEVWRSLRADGRIGTEGAVLLDCYDHGGQVWSLAGEGSQCRWDTSRGAGVWVPDEHATDEINCRAALYTFGQVHDNGNWTRKSGRKRYYAVLDEQFGGTTSRQFAEWYDAFKWLQKEATTLSLPRSKAAKEKLLSIAKKRASKELAQSALVTYNDWLAGNVYGVVFATYNNTGTASSPVWDFEGSDECWGYYGSDWAVQALIEEMRALNAA